MEKWELEIFNELLNLRIVLDRKELFRLQHSNEKQKESEKQNRKELEDPTTLRNREIMCQQYGKQGAYTGGNDYKGYEGEEKRNEICNSY